jgi:hypothetical protein
MNNELSLTEHSLGQCFLADVPQHFEFKYISTHLEKFV